MIEITGDASSRLTSIEERIASLLGVSRGRFLAAKREATSEGSTGARSSATSSAARRLTERERADLVRAGMSVSEYRAGLRFVAERWRKLPIGTGKGQITAEALRWIQKDIVADDEPALLRELVGPTQGDHLRAATR